VVDRAHAVKAVTLADLKGRVIRRVLNTSANPVVSLPLKDVASGAVLVLLQGTDVSSRVMVPVH